MKLINDLITQLIDPNIYYSRFSFFESGFEAIEKKYSVSRSSHPRKLLRQRQSLISFACLESSLSRARVDEKQVLHEICARLAAHSEPFGRQNPRPLRHG